jgi:phosphoribosylformylglycinamidine synthase
MKYRAKVEIRLKPGLSDPEGETSADSLRDLGYKVSEVDISKVYYIHFDANSMEEAYKYSDEMCKKLLANPVKDDYKVEVERIE